MSSALFKWPVRVYYEDTDAGGVVYHARYAAFYERARTEILRQYHFTQQRLLDERIAFVVRRMTIEYFSPARLDDLLEVTTEIQSMSRTSIMFAQRIHRSGVEFLSSAEVLVVCVDLSIMKPIALPESIVAEFLQ